jgi:hypothetical protein
MDLKKKDLEKMCGWLVKTIKARDLEWLREHRPGIFDSGNGQEIICDGSIFDISYTIQDILNAKRRKDAMGYPLTGVLPKSYMKLFAETMNLQLPERAKKSEIVDLVLQRI